MTSAEEIKLNETNDEIKTKRNTFSLVSDVFVEDPCFFNAELKVPYQQFSTFCSFMYTLKLNICKETSLL